MNNRVTEYQCLQVIQINTNKAYQAALDVDSLLSGRNNTITAIQEPYLYNNRACLIPPGHRAIGALFGLMRKSTGHLYGEDEAKEHATDMGVLWASLTGIFSVAASERHVGGLTLEQMIDRLIGIYLQSRK